ncbi:hypothetical protein EMCRGX_G020748 [Ephydatia muelleri]
MAAKTNRDKDLEALRHKVSDLEASMVRVNDRLDEMDDKLKERSAMDSEHMKVACDKAVQEAIQKGELNAGNAEAIKAFRDTVRIDAGAVSPVVSRT